MSQRLWKFGRSLLLWGLLGYLTAWPWPDELPRDVAIWVSGGAVGLGFLMGIPAALAFVFRGPQVEPRNRAPVGQKLSPPGMFVRFRPLLAYSLLLMVVAPLWAPLLCLVLVARLAGIVAYQWLTPGESFERGILAAELAVIVDLGTPLTEAVQRLGKEAIGRFSTRLSRLPQVLSDLHWDLEAGALLSGALNHQDYFPPIWHTMVRLGERTGDLPNTLRSLSRLELRRRSKPDILRLLLTLLLAALTVTFLQSTVMPTFFSAIGSGDSRVQFWSSFWKTTSLGGTLICLAAFLLLFTAIFFPKFGARGRLLHRLERLPFLWRVVRLEQQVTATEAMLMGLIQGRPTVELLEYAALAVSHPAFIHAFSVEQAAAGSTLSQVLDAHPDLFLPEFRALVAQGEAVGELTEALQVANDFLSDLLRDEETLSNHRLEMALQILVSVLVTAVLLGQWLPMAEMYAYILSEGLQP